MNHLWLKKNPKNKKLIVFFNGWMMNEKIVAHLEDDSFDIVMINDYRDFHFSLFHILDDAKYDEKYLIAFSMGVYCANLFKDEIEKLNFNKKIALNGTNRMIDDVFGIPKRIYNLTIKLFNQTSFEKFLDNMFKKSSSIDCAIEISYKDFIKNDSETLKRAKQELISISKINPTNSFIKYDKSFVSEFDKIIPSKNQLNYWQSVSTKTIVKDAPHYIFNQFCSWSELIC